jgi:4-hydroxy-3-methylbut-2-enyl diphosphate reductase
MDIRIAKKAGFCFGVKRAIDMAFKLANEAKDGVYTLGPIIHNPQVVDKLAQAGVNATEDISSETIKVLLIRTHGIPPQLYEETQAMPYRVVDATCPFVKKAQQYAQMLKSEGYQVVILGDRNHPEVRGLVGYAGDEAMVINGTEPLPNLNSRVGIVVQTTKSVDTLKKVVSDIIDMVKEVKVYNTICDSTSHRLKETAELAKQADMMIVVGGKNSANTTRLTTLCRDMGVKAYHIETADEIESSWLTGCNCVGIIGGASTPGWIIDAVVEKLKIM